MTDDRRYTVAELGAFVDRADPLRPAETDDDPNPRPATSRAGWLIPLILIAVAVAAVAWRLR